jgi:hypothetical protein
MEYKIEKVAEVNTEVKKVKWYRLKRWLGAEDHREEK